MQSLVFFNKEGDNLNFRWRSGDERFEGELIFHENSNDTFKTIGLYVFEKIPQFEYELPGSLKLQKFQLFNENRISFIGNSFLNQSITKIEGVNNDREFFSKWVYGEDFEKKFPIGSEVIFNSEIFEFTNKKQSYTVIGGKKDAFLILTNIDNKSFNESFGSLIGLTNSYINKTVSGLNSIGIYDYVDEELKNKLKPWNEPEFYNKYFVGKKLTVLGTDKNDGLFTVNQTDIFDKVFWKWSLPVSKLTQNSNLTIELVLKSDLPSIYRGQLKLEGNRIKFDKIAPTPLKPGVEFNIPDSILNTKNLVIDTIPQFNGISNITNWATQSLVIWENSIYECIRSYTWTATSSITPGSASYWSKTTYLPLTTNVENETLFDSNLQLTTNRIIFTQSFTQSSEITLASAVKRFKEDFLFYNIDLSYNKSVLTSELIYPTKYAEVNYWSWTHSDNIFGENLTSTKRIYEHRIGIKENLTPEINKNLSERSEWNIVFVDLDEDGIRLTINGQEFEESTDFVYEGVNVNLQRTIDKTIRNWLLANYPTLIKLGIIVNLKFSGSGSSLYYNTINLTTQYPNVPLEFNVRVGTTADYYIQHTDITFFDVSNYINIIINGRSYGQSVNFISGIPNIVEALEEWISKYSLELSDYGIFVENIGQMIQFRVKRQTTILDISLNVGKSSLPGIENWRLVKKFKGNLGSLITSNTIQLPLGGTNSFESLPFATGQIVSINNTSYPLTNVEYNILYLGAQDLVLSYQGPFWGSSDNFCNISSFVSIAFNSGFGSTGCIPKIVPTQSQNVSGEIDMGQFNKSFNLYNPSLNEYDINTIDIFQNTDLKEAIYLDLTGNIYVFGTKMSVLDGLTFELRETIDLPGNTTPILLKFNQVNNLIYALSDQKIWVVDPTGEKLKTIINLPNIANDIEFNTTNGDLYVSFNNISQIHIWSQSNLTDIPTSIVNIGGSVLQLAFNDVEKDMYGTTNNNLLVRISGSSRTIRNTYNINGLRGDLLFYEPINSSLYIFDNSGLLNFNSGTTSNISLVGTSSFCDLIFDPLKGDIKISQNSGFTRLGLENNIIATFSNGDYGKLLINPYDSMIYLASANTSNVCVIDFENSFINFSKDIGESVRNIFFNPQRNTVMVVGEGAIHEITVNLFIFPTEPNDLVVNSIDSNNSYGSLNKPPRQDIWLKTREYIRKPRENYNNEPKVKYVWKWESDQYPQMFLYDFSGNQLPVSGNYAYIGPKPLPIATLNRFPNKDILKVSMPEYQQTIFNEIVTELERIDSEEDLSIVPEPIELFIGFKGDNEGPIESNLLLLKRWDINFTITPTSINNNIIEFKFVRELDGSSYGTITLDTNSQSIFTYDENGLPRGLKPGQLIKISLKDITNNRNKYNPLNDGRTFKIKSVFTRQLVVDFVDILLDESNKILSYPTSQSITYLGCDFNVLESEVGRFRISGQTEVEDIRYKIELSNVGQNVGPDDIYIFKTYDINEQGIDWTFLNRKRKEMLGVRHDIFPYIGSYKSIINAINFFGYNDLELYEYYRNINTNSTDFGKLFKVEIPDIFDNSTPGFKVNDFIKHTMPNPNYEDTNLFNLTYKITDKDGNNILLYSLAEVIIKLEGLKYWLERKIVPITHRILDITGRADFVGLNTIQHRTYDAKIINIKQEFTPIDFVLNEAYLNPVNSGSSVWTCNLEFFTDKLGQTPDYFTINIRTWKTYREWDPFTTYTLGEKVQYFGDIYENVIESNKLRNPRKFSNAPKWNTMTNYSLGQFVEWDMRIYQYIGTQSSFSISGTESNLQSPLSEINSLGSLSNWIDNTEWIKINWEPVQTIKEWRTGTQSFNFTIDSNIDPYVTIEVTSDNGFGQIFNRKRNYEIRGTNDLFTQYEGEKVGTFQPIILIR